jgi:hypothetical protein
VKLLLIDPIWEPLMRFLERSQSLLPVLLAITIVLLVGLILAWLVEATLRRVLQAVGFDRLGHRPRVSDSLRRAGLRAEPSVLVGQLFRWLIVIATLLAALSILSAEATDVVLAAMVTYLPRLVAGLFLLVAGYAVSAFAGRSVLIWSVNAQVQGARFLAAGVRLLVGVFFAALALENLGFGRDIALVVLAILLGGFVFAAALSYGLAGQDLARQSLDRMTREARGEDHETLSHL